MKKVALLAVILIVINFGFLKAQTDQGKILVGVSSTLNFAGAGSDLINIGFSSVKYKSDADGFVESDPDRTTSINFSPKIGYFVADNFAVGLDLNAALSSTTDGESDDKYSSRLFSVGPFVRYYIPTAKLLPFFELSGSFGTVIHKSDYDDNTAWEDNEFKSNLVSLGGGIGFAAPLGERVTFDFLAGYNTLTLKEDNDDNDMTIIGTLGLRLGFSIFLGKN